MRRAILTLGGTVAGVAALLSFKTHSAADVTAAGSAGAASSASSAASPGSSPHASPGPAASRDHGRKMAASSGPKSAWPAPKSAASAPSATSAATSPSPAAAASPSAAPRAPTASPASAMTRTVTGTVATTPYGPMQVQIVLAGTRISKVSVLQQTDSGQKSSQIDSFAIPQLTSETLTAQSARIDAVSGATYTSQGYIQSLQGALDAAQA